VRPLGVIDDAREMREHTGVVARQRADGEPEPGAAFDELRLLRCRILFCPRNLTLQPMDGRLQFPYVFLRALKLLRFLCAGKHGGLEPSTDKQHESLLYFEFLEFVARLAPPPSCLVEQVAVLKHVRLQPRFT